MCATARILQPGVHGQHICVFAPNLRSTAARPSVGTALQRDSPVTQHPNRDLSGLGEPVCMVLLSMLYTEYLYCCVVITNVSLTHFVSVTSTKSCWFCSKTAVTPEGMLPK